jgi:EAL domain-containing protein (putative c-di-GMP-specific phosphodiesterase class I)
MSREELSLATSEPGRLDHRQEAQRLAVLASTGVLDTPPEPGYDAITRLAADYFQVDGACIGFADASRFWIKSSWGQHLHELLRRDHVFDLVLARDGPVIIPNVSTLSEMNAHVLNLRELGPAFWAAVPVRSLGKKILGLLTIFSSKPRHGLTTDELRILEGLADLVSSKLELARLRNIVTGQSLRRVHGTASVNGNWPRKADLRLALDERQFVLHYQPVIDFDTLRIDGLEALIRWQHPERGLIAPMDFIPRAEESGIILAIGDWVLSEACSQIKRWCIEDPRNTSLRVSVNLSACQFSRPGLADSIQALLLQSGISSRQLGLEMTESSLISNMGTAKDTLANLRRLGISMWMDDFGTGYSSLSHLHSLPFDVLKIDGSFVVHMAEREQFFQIVRTIIELARVLGMDVVAEGIETCEQFRLLRQLGCRYGQGFLFAPPLNTEAVTRLLRLPGRVLPNPGTC